MDGVIIHYVLTNLTATVLVNVDGELKTEEVGLNYLTPISQVNFKKEDSQ